MVGGAPGSESWVRKDEHEAKQAEGVGQVLEMHFSRITQRT